MKANAVQEDPTGQSLVKAVVLYSEFESGVRARALLSRVAHQAGCQGRVQSVFWRFDVMSQPLVAREALYHAADADIVLLAASAVSSPPAWLLEWLEGWAITRRVQDAVLAAWCRGHGGAQSAEGIGTLRKLADRYGLEWLCAEETEADAA
jgi:hypothetical protein